MRVARLVKRREHFAPGDDANRVLDRMSAEEQKEEAEWEVRGARGGQGGGRGRVCTSNVMWERGRVRTHTPSPPH
eukprot:2480108-Prymnesium_polylepis.1